MRSEHPTHSIIAITILIIYVRLTWDISNCSYIGFNLKRPCDEESGLFIRARNLMGSLRTTFINVESNIASFWIKKTWSHALEDAATFWTDIQGHSKLDRVVAYHIESDHFFHANFCYLCCLLFN